MSNYTFRPAVREQVGLLIGLIGPSGGGKTMSAMKLASGIVGPGGRFAVIDTESRRALHYADMFQFDHCELHAPFRPESYTESILAAAKAGYKAIVVDSFSHEWAGEGGILDWQEEELQRMAGDDWKKREACKMAAWIKPKMSHKKMVQRLLQVNCHLILCFRAEEKVKMEKEKDERSGKEKTVIVPIGWQPICSKELPFELTTSFLLTPDRPGFPQPLKLQEQHKGLFPLDKPVNEESGRRVAEWAAGGSAPKLATEKQQKDLWARAKAASITPEEFMLAHGSLKALAADSVPAVEEWIKEREQPTLCPSCNGPLTDGHCYSQSCPNGEPPPAE
jgi:hypothetical protein